MSNKITFTLILTSFDSPGTFSKTMRVSLQIPSNWIYPCELLLVMEKYGFKAASEGGPPRLIIEFPAVLQLRP